VLISPKKSFLKGEGTLLAAGPSDTTVAALNFEAR
jgi:phosphopantetheinyl transferase